MLLTKNEKEIFFADLKSTEEFQELNSYPSYDVDIELISTGKNNHYVFEKKLFGVDNSNVVFMRHPSNIAVLPHSHNFIEMEYVYSGQITQYINNKRIILNQRSLCIFNKNVIHSIKQATNQDHMYHIFIDEDLFDLRFFGLIPDDNRFSNYIYESLFINKHSSDYLLINGLDEDISELIEAIYKEFRVKHRSYIKTIYAYMAILFQKLYRNECSLLGDSVKKDITKKRGQLVQIMDYLQKNYRAATLVSMAKAHYLHPNYLCRLIKELTGKTFTEILNQTRMEMASHFLVSTEKTIEAISHAVGYENPNYFYKIFKDHFGMTPGYYRDNIRKSVN
ncbi:MAG: AraC family transcriptional regulator [Firmicutes bacterium]|nr:AraC family transcriptional regulator [Bacillota bacterium]